MVDEGNLTQILLRSLRALTDLVQIDTVFGESG